MEQETKNKKQPNLKRVILWTTLISVVATLVLYYFSYIFPIPAVEIDATGIPQTKEEYEQWYLKKLIIQNSKVPESELEFGDKIISYSNTLYEDVLYVYSKSSKNYVFLILKFETESGLKQQKTFSFEVSGTELVGFDGHTRTVYEPKYWKRKVLAIFNREKEILFFYNLFGAQVDKKYLPKETKFGYSTSLHSERLAMNKKFIINDPFRWNSVYFEKPIQSNEFHFVELRSGLGVHEYKYYIFDNDSLIGYGSIFREINSKASWIKKLDYKAESIILDCPILNTSDGLYFTFIDEQDEKLRIQKISDTRIEPSNTIEYNLDFFKYFIILDDHIDVYVIQFRHRYGIFGYSPSENLIQWKLHVPGKFKWFSKYGSVICTDKGMFSADYKYSTFKSHLLIDSNKTMYLEDSYPYFNLFGCRNFIYERIEYLLKVNIDSILEYKIFYLLGIAFIIGLIFVFYNKDKHDKKVADVEYYKQDDRYL